MRYSPNPDVVAEVMAMARPNFVEDEEGKRRPAKRCLKRGKFERRWIAQKTIDGVEYALHATKGWRHRRI